VVDARRCITAHTVENPNQQPWPHAPPLHGWVFGCDVCQEVCPWSRRGVVNPALPGRPHLAHLKVEDLLLVDPSSTEALLEGTPLARAKVKGLKRNAEHQRGS
jgi:epoxyqueuosine reductase